MVNYVCIELSNPELLTDQTCQKWTVLEQQNASVLPDLTDADRDATLEWIVGIFALVYVVKRIRRMLGS